MIYSGTDLSLNKILRGYGGDFSLLAPAVEEGLDFILGHFDLADYIWPRTISTKTSQGRQILIYNKEEALASSSPISKTAGLMHFLVQNIHDI